MATNLITQFPTPLTSMANGDFLYTVNAAGSVDGRITRTLLFTGAPGSASAGEDITLKGGAGAGTNKAGGNVIIQGGVNTGSGVVGGALFAPVGVTPMIPFQNGYNGAQPGAVFTCDKNTAAFRDAFVMYKIGDTIVPSMSFGVDGSGRVVVQMSEVGTTRIKVQLATNEGSNLPGIAVSSDGAYAFSATSAVATQDSSLIRIAPKVIGPADGTTGNGAGWLQNTAGVTRVTTQFDKTNTTLATVTGLTRALQAGRSYKFIATLPVTADAVGGYKVSMDTSDTLTATAIYYDVIVEASGVAPSLSRQSALAGTASGTLGTTVKIWVEGMITVNAAGTLAVKFAQSAANGTSSVLVGADLWIEDYP